MSDSLGLEDFAIGLASFVLNLPDGKVKFSGRIQITEELQSILLVRNFFFSGWKGSGGGSGGGGQVKITFWRVHANYNLPERQAAKLTFFAPCHLKPTPLTPSPTKQGVSHHGLTCT